jgi:hypothetical protein
MHHLVRQNGGADLDQDLGDGADQRAEEHQKERSAAARGGLFGPGGGKYRGTQHDSVMAIGSGSVRDVGQFGNLRGGRYLAMISARRGFS